MSKRDPSRLLNHERILEGGVSEAQHITLLRCGGQAVYRRDKTSYAPPCHCGRLQDVWAV
jgi:hypothetical protein